MPLNLMRQDITRLAVDAIVNAANEQLKAGGGVCGAIFAAAGNDDLQQACDAIGHVRTGSAVATPAFALPAKHVIHTAGPVWRGGTHGERDQLASCYRSSLALAHELGDASIAFPLISAGIFGFPPAQALQVAVEQIRAYLEHDPDMEVTLCLFDRRATTLSQDLYGDIQCYVDDVYVDASPFARMREESFDGLWFGSLEDVELEESPAVFDAAAPSPPASSSLQSASWASAAAPDASLEYQLQHLDEPFSQTLLAMIDERGLTDADVYARANLSRQYFSKLRSGKVNPSKRVVLSLAVALRLSPEETRLLLERAGHALTHTNKFDIIVEWFITRGRYDVFEINEALFSFEQPLLGAS